MILRGGSTLTVESLRTELDRFAKDTIQAEIAGLREYIDTALKKDRDHQQVKKRTSISTTENGGADLCWFDGERTDDMFAQQTSYEDKKTDGGRVARSSTSHRISELGWCQRRAGFNTSLSQEQPYRRHKTRWHTYHTKAQRPGDESYARLSRRSADDEMGEYEEAKFATVGASRDMALTGGEPPVSEACCVNPGEAWERFLAWLETIVMSDHFDFAFGGVILANAALIGIETEYMASHWCTETPRFFQIADLTFCFVFLSEVMIRALVSGKEFFTESGWKWNLFDLFVVCTQLADECMRFLTHYETVAGIRDTAGNQLNATRILRLFRLIRLLRLTRVLYLAGGLRMLVVSISDSLRSLAWTLVLLLALTFVFGVFLTQLVTDTKVRDHSPEDKEEIEELLEFFGSLDRSILCLYQTISEGIHWNEVVQPLMKHCGYWLALVFIIYMSFSLFALMNVVTGVFCESAIRTADEDKRQVLAKQMHELFMAADDDGSGTINEAEFESHLKDEQMLSYLKAIDVNPEEARHLFSLLADGNGDIEAAALVNGCLRLQGSAKAIELAAFVQEHKFEYQRMMEHVEHMRHTLGHLCEHISSKEDRQRRALESPMD